MRAFVGARLFRVAGHSVYGGVSGQLSPLVVFLFVLGFVLPFAIASLLR